jgi:HSF-type DNA-binding
MLPLATINDIYIQQLMEVLDNEQNADIIGWLPHGRAFVIYRKQDFETDVLPKYFYKQSKYSSFTRKLNRWGFVRVTRGPETGAYYHRCFKRGEHRLCMQMSCHSNPTTGATASNDAAPMMVAQHRPYPSHFMHHHHQPLPPTAFYHPLPPQMPLPMATTAEQQHAMHHQQYMSHMQQQHHLHQRHQDLMRPNVLNPHHQHPQYPPMPYAYTDAMGSSSFSGQMLNPPGFSPQSLVAMSAPPHLRQQYDVTQPPTIDEQKQKDAAKSSPPPQQEPSNDS